MKLSTLFIVVNLLSATIVDSAFSMGSIIEIDSVVRAGGNLELNYRLNAFNGKKGVQRSLVDDDGFASLFMLHGLLLVEAENSKIDETSNQVVNEPVKSWSLAQPGIIAALVRLRNYYSNQMKGLQNNDRIEPEKRAEIISFYKSTIAEVNDLIRISGTNGITYKQLNTLGDFIGRLNENHQYQIKKGTDGQDGTITIQVAKAMFTGRDTHFPERIRSRCADSVKGDIKSLAKAIAMVGTQENRNEGNAEAIR